MSPLIQRLVAKFLMTGAVFASAQHMTQIPLHKDNVAASGNKLNIAERLM